MNLTRRRLFAAASGLALGASFPALAGGIRVIGGPAFGASWRLTIARGVPLGSLQRELQAVVSAVDRGMSPFRADSAVTQFNDSTSTDWIALPPETCAVVDESLRIARFTMGAFDPTVGPLVARYGFGPISREPVGRHGELVVRPGAARKARPGLSLDLCGIAKGHALDLMANVVRSSGASNFLLEVGGEIIARGRHPTGRRWQVGIESPLAGAPSVRRLLQLDGAALATSGDLVNSYWLAGRRYCHIIDPRSWLPADNRLASVSVLAPLAASADALATALFVMGERAGVEFARREGISALFVVHSGAGLSDVMTGAFAERILA
ncbi:MAG: FAD:protein FMN transferase [Burkholderiaceae bacterium]|nr:FAD:protein FMN transferase [Burkholderiaceae bacterium]